MVNRKFKPGGSCSGCCQLQFSLVSTGRPEIIDAAYWSQATGEGQICGGNDSSGTLRISAQNLIPFGVYTAWFATDRGLIPAAPVGAVYSGGGVDPNRLLVGANGILNYYVAPLDFNPFKAVPNNGRMARIEAIVIGYNTDNTTFGNSPGTLGVNFFEQLAAPICEPGFRSIVGDK